METIWQLREAKSPELLLTNSIEIRIIELEKVKRIYEQDKNNKKAQWMLFLDDPNSEEVQEIMENNNEIKEATVIVKKMSEDEKLRRLADLREKAILDEKEIYRTGLHKGIKQGIKQEKIKTAKAMLKEKIEIELISKLTGLSLSEIEQLKNSK